MMWRLSCSNILKQEQNEVQLAQQVGSMQFTFCCFLVSAWQKATLLCTESIKLCAAQVQAKAQAMATALQTIGKFTIKKRSGDKESIFGR